MPRRQIVRVALPLVAGLLARTSSLGAQTPAAHAHHQHTDTAFAALQERGRQAMGVNQYTSSHRFEPLADGGRIMLQRDVEDSAGTATIREHLQAIAKAFSEGDFATPAFVHARGDVPGTAAMRARRARIHYEFHPLPRGGEVRITTADTAAVRAVHEFLAFQRSDHRTH